MSILDDGNGPSTDFIVVEAPDPEGHKQALWIGVRPVYHGNDKDREPTIQIAYQEEHMGSALQGPVFIDVETWEKIINAVNWRIHWHRLSTFQRFREWWWRKHT